MKGIDLAGATSLLKTAGKTLDKHSPAILTGIGVAGIIATPILAVRVTPKALALLDARLAEKEAVEQSDIDDEIVVDLTPVETVKTVWKLYLPAVITGVASIACVVGANSLNGHRQVALASAYTIAESTLKDYKAHVLEEVGEKKAEDIDDKVAADKLKENPLDPDNVVKGQGGDTLFYDPYSGRYYRSSVEFHKTAENEFNHYLIRNQTGSMNDWYEFIKLDGTIPGDYLVWTIDSEQDNGLMELKLSAQVAKNGEPCIVVNFIHGPEYDTYFAY